MKIRKIRVDDFINNLLEVREMGIVYIDIEGYQDGDADVMKIIASDDDYPKDDVEFDDIVF